MMTKEQATLFADLMLEISKLSGSEKQKNDQYAQRLEEVKEALAARAKYRSALNGGSSLAKGGGHAS